MAGSMNRRELGAACCVACEERGWYRIISENGRCDLLRSGAFEGRLVKVGDVGRLFYDGDGRTFGAIRFVPDPSVTYDAEKAKEEYLNRFPGAQWESEWPFAKNGVKDKVVK